MDFSRMTIGEIASLPEFTGFDYMVGEENPLLASRVNAITIPQMCRLFPMPVWDEKSLTDGIDYLYEKARAGRVLYDIYDGESKTPAVAKTGIAAFTVGEKAPFVIICAGGSYQHVCKIQEGYPIAKRLNELGIAAFVLQYRTGRYFSFEGAMQDVAKAVDFVQRNAETFNVYPDDYAVMGFSAGGHVASLFGTKNMGYKACGVSKPTAIMLGYPAISLRAMGDQAAAKLFGAVPTEEMKQACSVEENVDGDYPKSFIWCFEKDNTVNSAEHAIRLGKELESKGVSVRSEVFDGVLHGVGLGDHCAAKGWVERAVQHWRG